MLLTFGSCTDDDPFAVDPEQDVAEKFLGTWHVSDNAQKLNYDVVIERNTVNSNSEIILNNFAGVNGSVKGYVTDNSVVISKQQAGEGYMVEGSGSYINNGKLEFTYTLDDGIDSELRKAVFTK
jgi:hypothetical protein